MNTRFSPSRHHAIALAVITALGGISGSARADGDDDSRLELAWSTYFGGKGVDRGAQIAASEDSGVLLAGQTDSDRGLATKGAAQSESRGGIDAVLVHFDQDGDREWSMYFGGEGTDRPTDVAVDEDGAVYLVGSTDSKQSITKKAQQDQLRGQQDGFVAKFDDDGDRVWSTYLGGDDEDTIHGVAVDDDGSVFVCGSTKSKKDLARSADDDDLDGQRDAFVARLNKRGKLEWATYFGGDGEEDCLAITVHEGRVYVAGQTDSDDQIATEKAHQDSCGGDKDAFVAKFDGKGERLWSTYYGGSGDDRAQSIAVDEGGAVYVAGSTRSKSGIATKNAHQRRLQGERDLFLVKFGENGQRRWGTYFGGEDTEDNADLKVQGGRIYLAGETESEDDIATDDTYVSQLCGEMDVFVATFDAQGDRRWATYLGGKDDEEGPSLALCSDELLYVAGATQSSSQIATDDGFDEDLAGKSDLFVTQLEIDEN